MNAANESVAGGTKNQSLVATNTYTKPLYFLTANYRVQPDWSMYAQVATSFLVPSLSALYVKGANIQGLQPQTTISYQAGTVYTHGNVTVDADIYRVDASNLQVACSIPDPTAANPGAVSAGYCNAGKARFSGVEGEGAYAFDFGLTVFANGSLNSAKQLATPANPAAGIAATPAGTLANAPKWTYAAGGIYHNGPWALSLAYKNSGAYISDDGPRMPGYDTLDASVRYDFSKRLYVQFQAFNLADQRATTTLKGGLYQFQAGRTLEGTIAASF